MSRGGPENGCPEPDYPIELRRDDSRFESRIDLGHEGEGIIYQSPRRDDLPMNVALAQSLDSMDEKRWAATLRYHLELAEEFDGPGGP